MNWFSLWMAFGVFGVNCLQTTHQCSPLDGWRPMLPEERAQRADIVIFGTILSNPHGNADAVVEGRYSVLVQVHCIIKGPKVAPFINVSGFSDFSGGRCVHSRVSVNKSYVVFVEYDVDNPGGFRVLEVNVEKGAVHTGHKLSVLRDVMYVAGDNATLPIGVATNSLPGCPDFSNSRRFRDPATNGVRHPKSCRCRKKKHKRKKHKRIFHSTKVPQTKVRWNNDTRDDTLPRTPRYVLNLQQDEVKDEYKIQPSEMTMSLSSAGSRQSMLHWCCCLLTLHNVFIVMWLLPT